MMGTEHPVQGHMGDDQWHPLFNGVDLSLNDGGLILPCKVSPPFQLKASFPFV